MGYWIAINKGEVGYSAGDFRCTDCGRACPCYHLTPFCPNCGNKMQTTKGLTPMEMEILRAEADDNLKRTDCPWK